MFENGRRGYLDIFKYLNGKRERIFIKMNQKGRICVSGITNEESYLFDEKIMADDLPTSASHLLKRGSTRIFREPLSTQCYMIFGSHRTVWIYQGYEQKVTSIERGSIVDPRHR
jgi:hypothetical protein